MGHGKSKEFMEKNKLPEALKVIDLSHDFRLKREGNSFVYGLPELNREEIKKSKYIANPGCFATGIQLALLPLAADGLLNDEVHIQVYNSLSKHIHSITSKKSEIDINLSDEPQGIYFIEALYNGETKTYKILKQ